MRAPSVLLVLAATAAAAVIEGQSSAIVLPLARGGNATIAVTISNSTSNDIPLATFEGLAPLPWVQAEYSFAALTPTVCSVGYGNLDGSLLESFEISTTSLPANSAVVCSIGIHRDASSYHAFETEFQPASYLAPGITTSDASWIIGPVADLSIESRQISPWPLPGSLVGFVRITIGNKGPWDVQHADFGYCQDSVTAPFALDNDVADGCGAAQSGPVCFATGLPSVQFGVGPLAANQTTSCVLRVIANAPLTALIGFPAFLVDEPQSSSGEYPADPDPSDNVTALTVAPSEVSAVPLGYAAWAILSGLLALAGSISASRKSMQWHLFNGG
jgi:hypothetical protein